MRITNSINITLHRYSTSLGLQIFISDNCKNDHYCIFIFGNPFNLFKNRLNIIQQQVRGVLV